MNFQRSTKITGSRLKTGLFARLRTQWLWSTWGYSSSDGRSFVSSKFGVSKANYYRIGRQGDGYVLFNLMTGPGTARASPGAQIRRLHVPHGLNPRSFLRNDGIHPH
jgi:hypothetical protein